MGRRCPALAGCVADGETLSAQFLIAATGFLCQPRTPDIPGIETFHGRIIHAAEWDESYSFKDVGRQSSEPDPPACSSFPNWPRKPRS